MSYNEYLLEENSLKVIKILRGDGQLQQVLGHTHSTSKLQNFIAEFGGVVVTYVVGHGSEGIFA